jgi:hypothetical protein
MQQTVTNIYKMKIDSLWFCISVHSMPLLPLFIFFSIFCSVHAYIVFKEEQSARAALSHNMAPVRRLMYS